MNSLVLPLKRKTNFVKKIHFIFIIALKIVFILLVVVFGGGGGDVYEMIWCMH